MLNKRTLLYHKRSTCRGCGSDKLNLFLRLGPTPLANSFLKSPDEFGSEKKYPLDVYFCRTCSLVQLLDVIDPEILFRNYIYVTGTSDTIAEHNRKYADTVARFQNLKADDLVVEVASNDGSLLQCFKSDGVRTLGVEPAKNIAEIARNNGIETVNEFFDSKAADTLRKKHGPAKVIIGNNVLAHVDDTRDFLNGCKSALDNAGIAVFEVPYLAELLKRLEYDTIYHEHLCYFSVTSIVGLCDKVGLSVIRVDEVPIHGGSLRIYAGGKEHFSQHHEDVMARIRSEQQAGLGTLARYERFAENVENNRRQLLNLLKTLQADGKTLAAYGAPAKGNTLLNYCGIGTDIIPYTVDKNPLKVGKYTPGMHIPVLEVSALLERQPDYLLVLAWNFADEIMRQQEVYQQRGGRFIIPIPKPEVI
jgi:hypothetical protein